VSGQGEAGPAARPPTGKKGKVDEAQEAAIAAYLEAHPDFLQRHKDILGALTPPSLDRGVAVVDFQRFMVSRLRDDVGRLTEENAGLIQTARANAHGQARIHAAALALIEARSLGQMIEVLTGDLMDVLDVDVIAMAVESNGVDLPHVAASGIRIVEPDSISDLMGERGVLLRGGVTGNPAIYGPGAGLIRSEALLKLTISRRTPIGLVAFGSRDGELFHEGQGTEHIAFLGGVIERLLRVWLDLPP
jgi:uncharacterized protein YigA (DUF484 family)